MFPVESIQSSSITGHDVFHIFIDLSTLGFMVFANYLSLNRGMVIADRVECSVMCVFILHQCYPELMVRYLAFS